MTHKTAFSAAKSLNDRDTIDLGSWRYAHRTGQLVERLATDWRDLDSPSQLTVEEWGEHLLAMVDAARLETARPGLFVCVR